MRILPFTVVVVFFVVCVGHITRAQTPWDAEQLRCVTKGSFDVDRWSIAGMHLEHSTLGDVENKIGPAKRFRIGRDAVSAQSLCYSIDEEQVAVFESGPIGGPEGVLLAISLLKRSDLPPKAECVQPKRDLKEEISSDRAVGASRADVEKIAGADHCFRDAAMTEWNFKQQHDDWTTLSGMHASFDHDKLLWWRVYSVTSQ